MRLASRSRRSRIATTPTTTHVVAKSNSRTTALSAARYGVVASTQASSTAKAPIAASSRSEGRSTGCDG